MSGWAQRDAERQEDEYYENEANRKEVWELRDKVARLEGEQFNHKEFEYLRTVLCSPRAVETAKTILTPTEWDVFVKKVMALQPKGE